jgi:hypothetical protein
MYIVFARMQQDISMQHSLFMVVRVATTSMLTIYTASEACSGLPLLGLFSFFHTDF